MSGKKKMKSIKRSTPQRRNLLPWLLSVGLIALSVIVLVATNTRDAHGQHPAPRDDAHHMRTVAPTHYRNPYIAETYRKAARIKEILDGLFCWCFCNGAGHYSLLDCFKDDHGAGCDICLEEANIAHDMHGSGASLDEIRDRIDAEFGK